MDRHTRSLFVTAAALFGATLAVYWPVRSHEFLCYDDPLYIVENLHVRAGWTLEGLAWAFRRQVDNWHPLTWLSSMLDCELFGLEAGLHLLVNAVIHALAAVALLLALRSLTGAFWASAFVAAAFALHPLRVESVAWASERKDVLSGLFWMLTLLAYARYVRRPRAPSHLLVLAGFALGLMAKPMVVTLPFVLLLLDYWPLQRKEPVKRLVLEKMPLFALAAISCMLTVVSQRSGGALREGLPLDARLANALVSYVAYLWKTVWPTELAVFYPHPYLNPSAKDALVWQSAVAGLCLAAVTAWVVRERARRRYLIVGWLWYVGTLVPVIGIVQVGMQSMADRYTYIPLIGVYAMVAFGVRELVSTRGVPGRAVAVPAIAVLVALAVATRRQVRHWRDSEALFTHALAVTERNFVAHNNLGTLYEERGELDKALASYRAADEIHTTAHSSNNVAAVLIRAGQFDEAERFLARALALETDHPDAHNNLGTVLISKGRYAEAAQHLERALRLEPHDANSHSNLGLALQSLGRIDEAIAHHRKAAELAPASGAVHFNLGWALEQANRLVEAAAEHRLAMRYAPQLIEPARNLAWILCASRDASVRDGREALRLATAVANATQFRDASILELLAAAYAESGDFAKALEWQERAVAKASPQGSAGASARLALYETRQPYRR